MTCPKCGANNIDGSSFCVKCGANLKEPQINSIPNQQVMQNNQNIAAAPQQPTMQSAAQQNLQTIAEQNLQNMTQTIQPTIAQPIDSNIQQNIAQPTVTPQPQPTISNQQPTDNKAMHSNPLNYINFIISILMKPYKSFKAEEDKLSDTKTSLIFSLIISGLMMIITLISTIISTIFVKKMDYSTFKYKTVLDFSQLKDLDWISVIGKNLLIFAGIIFGIAAIYYIASLVFKKSANYIKNLSITAASLIPYVALGMIVSPLIGKIWAPLSLISIIVGVVYSLLIFINLIDKDLTFESTDLKIYFHLICLSIIVCILYYLYIKLISSSISSDISGILDILG